MSEFATGRMLPPPADDSDRVLIFLDRGCSFITPPEASRYRHLLKDINASRDTETLCVDPDNRKD